MKLNDVAIISVFFSETHKLTIMNPDEVWIEVDFIQIEEGKHLTSCELRNVCYTVITRRDNSNQTIIGDENE